MSAISDRPGNAIANLAAWTIEQVVKVVRRTRTGLLEREPRPKRSARKKGVRKTPRVARRKAA